MKRITIYNEKGGVGKTTVTAMLASFLAYREGRRVCVADFDYPSYHMMDLRRSDIEILRDPKSPLSLWMAANPSPAPRFDIFRLPPAAGGHFQPEDIFAFLDSVFSVDYDYILYDFPGRFSSDEPVSFVAGAGLIDYVAIPIDTDIQSRRSALVVADAFKREGIPLSLFWNRVSLSEAQGSGLRFQRGAAPFTERGMDVMEESLRDIRKISRPPSEMAFIRSTICFPERYVNRWNSAIIPFLQALKERIDSSVSSKSTS